MKATLETTEPSKQLRMCDLEPGDIAEILPGCGEHRQYDGWIIAISHRGDAMEIGGGGDTWTGGSALPVRRLTPGEKIVIS